MALLRIEIELQKMFSFFLHQVKDDVSLLQKAMNRKKGTKKKSKLQWKERGEKVEKDKEAKAKKREANLSKKADEKKKHKLKKAAKRGRVIPGY